MGDAILQIEFARKRMDNANIDFGYSEQSVSNLAWGIARGCLNDVIRNGGTFVVVADNETITIVQRSEAEKIPTRKKNSQETE